MLCSLYLIKKMIKKTYIIPGLLIFDIRYIRKTIHDDI